MDAESGRWNDDRLDEFATNVDRRFDQVDRRFDKVGERFDRIEDRMESGFNRLDDRLDFLGRAMIATAVSLTSAVIAGFAAIVVLIATQL